MARSRAPASPWFRAGAIGSAITAMAVCSALAGSLAACARQVHAYAPPRAPVTQISNAEYQALLARYVGANGKIDYARWNRSVADVATLDSYLSTLTNATPATRPDLFKAQPDRLSYWLNLYNAIVLREILRRWPLASVTDVRVGAADLVETGKGFFYDLEFVIGGQPMNLHDIENKVIRARFKDARVHFAIHCGSSSCPLLQPEAFDADRLETQLESASTQFVNDPRNVFVDDAKKQVVMSKVFEWYQGELIALAKRRLHVEEAGVVDFAVLYASKPLEAKLREAKAKSYAVVFRDYDWRVDKQEPVPDVELRLPDGGGVWRPSDARGKVLLIEFFATFSRPCRRSFPRLQALHAKYAAAGLVVVGVAEDDEPIPAVPTFIKESGATFLVALDPEQVGASSPFKIRAIPTELLVDRRGFVRYRHEGADEGERDEVAARIEGLLNEK